MYTNWKARQRKKGIYPFTVSSVYELKFKKGFKKLMNYKSDFRSQQIQDLIRANTQAIDWKISDIDPRTKPFDCLQLVKVKAFAVLLWYEPRKTKTLYHITPQKLQNEINQGKKSISKQRAEEIADFIFEM